MMRAFISALARKHSPRRGFISAPRMRKETKFLSEAKGFISEGKKPERCEGFTLLELLIVVAIIGLLTGVAIPAFSAFTRRQALTQATKNLKTDLRAAQNRAVSGVDGKRWGIHLVRGSGSYEVFSTDDSSVYSSGKATDFPSGVTASNLQVGGVNRTPANVIFDRLTGEVGVYRNNGTLLGSDIRITLTLSGTNRYVKVDSGGKVYEE